MGRILITICAFVLWTSLPLLTQDTSSQAGSAYPQSSTASQGQTSGDQTASTRMPLKGTKGTTSS
jgi:hypothetical protein